jgi:hypothetical protein
LHAHGSHQAVLLPTPHPPNLSAHPQEASSSYLSGILGFEERPLVSTDYVNDLRSSIVDADCTQVGLKAGAKGSTPTTFQGPQTAALKGVRS